MRRGRMEILFVNIIYMEIPNYDEKKKGRKYKQLHNYMPDRCFRMLITGPSGCGKTNTALHILMKPLIYYDKLYLYSKNLEQDKYSRLLGKLEGIADNNNIPVEELVYSSNGEIIPINEQENECQKVVIFDDYVCEKNQTDIIDYFIQGRHKNCSVMYLSQSYYKTPKDIRQNCSHYIIFDNQSKRENGELCREHGIDKEAFMRGFRGPYDFVYIDKPRKIVKRNFYGDL